jgi:putative transcriptional regulator
MDNKISIPWLLVASPQLEDPNFTNSVVLMVEENPEGAMGFIVNRPSEMPLKDLISEGLKVPPALPAWVGGPVESTTGFILHNQPHIRHETDTDIEVSEGIILSSSANTLEHMTENASRRIDMLAKLDTAKESLDVETLYPYRFLVGYGGWNKEQLDEEIRRGSWLQIPMDNELLFNTPWSKMWERAIASIGFTPNKLVHADQPYLN